jgi:hypothetical protein
LENRANRIRRFGYAAWLLVVAAFAVLHAVHLRADFPNGSPWVFDWAKFTDEGWYGNAAIRAHLFGNWYMPGDFNPATAVPVWPFLEWLWFFFTGVSLHAARALAIACFFLNLALSYLLLRAGGPRSRALLALTLLVTSPFLYCFSRLAILEPLQTTLTLVALNLAVRLPRMRRPLAVSSVIGLLFALMVLTKTTALFLLPAVVWAMVLPLWAQRRLAIQCALDAASTAAIAYSFWIAIIIRLGLFADYKYYFFINDYPKPPAWYWPLISLWWSLHGLLWIDHSLVLLAAVIVFAAAIAYRTGWGRILWRDPLFGSSLWVVAGYVLFMTLQNHPQPRYFAVPAFFCFFVVALGAAALLGQAQLGRSFGIATVALAVAAAAIHGVQVTRYVAHPEYTFVNAAAQLTHYIDAHPNGKRLLVSISGDQITLATRLPSLCDDFGTEDLAEKTGDYQPGWYASWNDIDAGTLEDLHVHFSLEQVAAFNAFDDPGRNLLVLFKLHPLPAGQVRDRGDQNLRIALPDDKIEIEVDDAP